MSTGLHEVEFTVGDLPGGVYYYGMFVNHKGNSDGSEKVRAMVILF